MWRWILTVALAVVTVFAALWLSLRRPDIPYDTLAARYGSPASQYTTLESGLVVHYRDQGSPDAPALVLVHGFSASTHTWEPWAARLKDDYRVISLDLPGHGLSRALPPDDIGVDAFVAVIDETTRALGVERFTLAGNSMGGNAAWRFGLDKPDRLDGLVLVDAAGWGYDADPGEADERPFIFKLLSNPVARAVIKDLDMSAMVRDGLEASYADPSFVDDALVERYLALSRAPGHRENLIAILANSDPGAEATADMLARIDTPTLVMHGLEDRVIPPSHGRRFAEAIPNAELRLYEAVGHLPQEEIPDRSVDDLRRFLETRVYAGAPPTGAPNASASPAPAPELSRESDEDIDFRR